MRQHVLLEKTDISIVVVVLYPEDEVANDGHTETVIGELLVGYLEYFSVSMN